MSVELKTAFKAHSFEPCYTGGSASLASFRGRPILATCAGEKAFIVDFQTGSRLAELPGDGELLTCLKLAPDASFLITCSRSFQMKIYKAEESDSGSDSNTDPQTPTFTLHRNLKAHESPVLVLAVDPTATLVASGAADGSVKVWDLSGGFATHSLKGHQGVVSALGFYGAPGSSRWLLASGGVDSAVRVHDLVKRRLIRVLDGHSSVVRALDFSADGMQLISAGRDALLNLWDLRTFRLLRAVPVHDAIETAQFAEFPGGSDAWQDRMVVCGGAAGQVALWDVSVGRRMAATQPRPASAEEVGVLSVERAEELYVAVMSDQTLWQLEIPEDPEDVINSALESPAELRIARAVSGYHGEIIDMVFCGSNPDSVALATNSPEVRLVSLADGAWECKFLAGHRDIVIAVAATLDGQWLATVAKDYQARLWRFNSDSGSFDCYAVFTGHTAAAGAVALPRTDPSVASASFFGTTPKFLITCSQDLTVKKWAVPKPGKEASDVPHKVKAALYTRKAHDKDINAADMAPNDELFATASQDKTVKLWDTETGEVRAVLKGHRRGVWAVKFSEYAPQLATASSDKTVRLWSVADGSCLRTFEGHTNSVLKVAFLSRGAQLVSAGGDGLVKVWDAASGECSATLDNHEDKVWSLAVRADDSAVVSGGGDGVLTVWEDVTAAARAEAAAARERAVEEEQALANFVARRDWEHAILLALTLDHPMRLFGILREVVAGPQEPGSLLGLKAVDKVVAQLNVAQLGQLLHRVRDWNTNSKTYVVAQRVVYAVLTLFGVETILEVPGAVKLIEPLLAYSQRHYNRVDELLEGSCVLEYVVGETRS